MLRTAWSLSRCLHFGLSRVCGERDGVTARGKRDWRSGERACPVHALVRHTLHLSQLIRPLAALWGLICNATCDNFNSSLSLALQHLRSLACLCLLTVHTRPHFVTPSVSLARPVSPRRITHHLWHHFRRGLRESAKEPRQHQGRDR